MTGGQLCQLMGGLDDRPESADIRSDILKSPWPRHLLAQVAKWHIFYSSNIDKLIMILNLDPQVVNEIRLESYSKHSIPAIKLLRSAGCKRLDNRTFVIKEFQTIKNAACNTEEQDEMEGFINWYLQPPDLKSLARIKFRQNCNINLYTLLANYYSWLPSSVKQYLLLEENRHKFQTSHGGIQNERHL
jgi:hypothetical protein